MSGSRLAGSLLVACALTIAAPRPSNAQFGGLIKKKIAEGAKKATGEDAAAEEAKRKTTGGDAAAAPATTSLNNDPSVIPLTDAVLTALEKGLQTEIDLREAFRKELAAMKTPEEYAACTQQTSMSPEGMQLVQRLGDLPENVTAEEMQKVMAQAGKDLEVLTLKVCGPDVRQFNNSWRAERLREIEGKAAAAAGPLQ